MIAFFPGKTPSLSDRNRILPETLRRTSCESVSYIGFFESEFSCPAIVLLDFCFPDSPFSDNGIGIVSRLAYPTAFRKNSCIEMPARSRFFPSLSRATVAYRSDPQKERSPRHWPEDYPSDFSPCNLPGRLVPFCLLLPAQGRIFKTGLSLRGNRSPPEKHCRSHIDAGI